MRIRPVRLALLLGVFGAATLVIPASPAFASLSLYRVDSASVSDDSTPKSVSVSCNGSDDVVGMGGRIVDGGGNVLMTKMYVNSGLDTVTVQGVEAVDDGSAWSDEVYAVCAPAGTVSGLELRTSPIVSNPDDKINTKAACTGNKATLGGGFKIEQGGGKVAFDELTFDATFGQVYGTAYVHDSTVGDFTLTVQAICATRPGQIYLKTWTSASNSISPKTETTPTCPVGTQPSATGGVLTGLTGDGSLQALEPHLTATASEVTGREIGTYDPTWYVEAQAVCIG